MLTAGAMIVALLVIFQTAGITYALRRAYLSMRANLTQQKKMLRLVSIVFALWLLLTMILSIGGYFFNYRYYLPRIALFGILPPLVFAIVLFFSKGFIKILTRIPPAWLMGVQGFRLPMELVLVALFYTEELPFQITFLGFNMNIIAGVTALFAGQVFFRKGRLMKPEVMIWNVFGILLLLNFVFILVTSLPSGFRIFNNEPSTELFTRFPYIWIPVYLVPYWLVAHLFSIRQIFLKRLLPFTEGES